MEVFVVLLAVAFVIAVGIKVLGFIFTLPRPVYWLRVYLGWLGSHDLRGRELTKACHGAGMILAGGQLVGMMQQMGAGDQAVEIATVIAAPLLLLGLFWLVSSGYFIVRSGSAGALDNEQLMRGVIKCALGVAFFHFEPFPAGFALNRIFLMPETNYAAMALVAGLVLLTFVAIWCVGTGAAKVLLLLLAKIRLRRNRAPAPMEDPHGRARAATRDESRRAGQGNKSALDNQRF